MKALHFASGFAPVPGGGPTRLAQLLLHTGVEHTLVVPQAPSPYIPRDLPPMPDRERMDNIDIHRVRLPRWPRPWIPLLSRLRQIRRDAHFLASLDPPDCDLVHAHSPWEFAQGGIEYARKHGKPVICEFHRLWFTLPEQRHPLVPALAHRANRAALLRIDKRLARDADLVLTQCRGYYEQLVEVVGVSPEKLVSAPIGVDGERFDPDANAAAGERWREEHGWGDRVVMLYSGYLAPATGTDKLLRALQGLSAETRRKMLVVFMGRGSLREAVAAFAREHPDFVRCEEFVPFEQMPAVYAAADVQLIPLPGGGWAEMGPPIKLLEGMAMRKLVLASDVRGVTDVMTPGHDGVVYHKDNITDLEAKLTQVANDFHDYDDIRRQARETVLRSHSLEHARHLLHDAYKRVLRETT